MRILERYVLKELGGPFLLGLFVFTFLLLANKLFRLMDLLIGQGVELRLVGGLFASIMLSLLSLTLPMAILVAVLIGLGRMSIDRELLAVRINGVSLFKVCAPIILVAFLFSALMVAANFTLMPRLMLRISDLLYQLQFRVLTALEPNRFYDNLGSGDMDITLYFAEKSPDQSMGKVQVRLTQEIREQTAGAKTTPANTTKKKRETLILAREGRIIPDEKAKTIKLELWNGMIIPLGEKKKDEDATVKFVELERLLKPELKRFEDGVYQKQPREMQLDELLTSIDKYGQSERKRDQRKLAEIKRELYQRISIPLSCLAFVLIGIPLALVVRPSGKSAGFAVSFALLFIYYAMLKWGSTMVDKGYALSWLAVLSPNILLGAIGSILIYFEVHK